MNQNQSRKKMAVIFSAAFICCSIPLCKMNAYAANTGELQSGTILAQKNSDEENDTVSEQIPAGVHKDTVPEGYTPIRTVEDLYGISSNTEGNYILMADIDLSGTKAGRDPDTGYGWQPIDSFSGILDGNGYRIMNLTIYGNPPVQKVGLFSEISGTVQNPGVTNADIRPSGNVLCIGGIAGCVDGAVIANCYVTGTLKQQVSVGESEDDKNTAYDADPYPFYGITSDIGGIAGKGTYFFSVKDCYTDVDLAGSGYVGGIMGRAERMLILRCYATGTVQSSFGHSGMITADTGDEFGIVKNSYYLAANGEDTFASELSTAQMKRLPKKPEQQPLL